MFSNDVNFSTGISDSHNMIGFQLNLTVPNAKARWTPIEVLKL